MTNDYCIDDYGAVADGITKNTSGIQQAIDDCTQAGGGRVVIPAGTYVSGTIFLKNHVELHLSAGAVLLASPDREDYNADEVFPENRAFAQEKVSNAHLIMAYRVENIAITGLGTIDGNSSSFFEMVPECIQSTYRDSSKNFPVKEWRPGQMVYFCLCRRVAVQDVKLLNSPFWTLFLHGCEDVQVRGLTISSFPATKNGDGLDIDCSCNVTVSDCIIRTGDDCITFRANTLPFQEAERKPCENVTVTNCVLSSARCALRVGVGGGTIRRCRFSGNTITDTNTGIQMICRWNPEGKSAGVRIEDLQFTDCRIDAANPIVMGLGSHAVEPASIRDVSFSRMRITASAGSQMVGVAGNPLQRITFHDVDWQVRGGTDNTGFVDSIPAEPVKGGYSGLNGKAALPCALYGVHLEDVEFQHFRVRWEEPSEVWRNGLRLEHANRVRLHQVALRQPQAGEKGAALHFHACDNVSLHGCRAEKDTGTFLRMAGSTDEGKLRVIGCDLSEAEQAFDVDGQISEAGNLYSSLP